MKEDLEVLERFLEEFNEVLMWHLDRWLKNELQVQSDALESIGFEMYFQGEWCARGGQTAGWFRVLLGTSPSLNFFLPGDNHYLGNKCSEQESPFLVLQPSCGPYGQ